MKSENLLRYSVTSYTSHIVELIASGGRSIPRWKPRSSRCVFVGNSLKHGHHVPLILNLETGAITGQYHVVLDDWFHTVHRVTSWNSRTGYRARLTSNFRICEELIEAEPSWLTRYDGPIKFTSGILIGYVCAIEDKQINRRQCFCRQP